MADSSIDYRRKKCDEQRPVCSRCENTYSHCVWPQHPQRPSSLVSNSLKDYIAINEALALGYPSGLETDYAGASGFEYNDVLVQPTSLLPSRPGATSVHTNLGECLDSSLLPSSIIAHTGLLQDTPALNQSTYPSFRGATVSRGANNTALKKWEYAQEYGLEHYGWILERFKLSKAGKYAILATATLFRSNYEQSPSTRSLRDHTKELHAIALKQLDLELNSIEVSPQAKLVALEEMTRYEYFANTSSNYFPHLAQSASTVREILQSDTIDLLSLSGNDTHDIRCFAWCDITNSMATSRPTLLNYESNLECTQHFDWEDAHANPSKGIEWIYGCPDVIAVLMARTVALKHLKIPKEERLSRGAKLEQLIFGWRFRPTHAKGSVMRVARVGVQEMWRHAAIIHIHQAIFRSDPTHSVVRDSVKSIIKIASPSNRELTLTVFYQSRILSCAGAFAISPKDRYTLKSRIIGCGNEPILRNLAVNLDDVWARTDSTGRFSSWSDKENSAIFF
ncbi:hypothetical protein RHS01_04172 [Rhizoctonia solani]|uniref:Zn(2)-C6 fungal-type domain-containing protein n=1 Tax=Rhizoctonia solani TaxID=456999 RepID=A0A8H7IK19_9AGAM|nr:hypothetical protein RHS01_04172 [Rhizoctonia solani]